MYISTCTDEKRVHIHIHTYKSMHTPIYIHVYILPNTCTHPTGQQEAEEPFDSTLPHHAQALKMGGETKKKKAPPPPPPPHHQSTIYF